MAAIRASQETIDTVKQVKKILDDLHTAELKEPGKKPFTMSEALEAIVEDWAHSSGVLWPIPSYPPSFIRITNGIAKRKGIFAKELDITSESVSSKKEE